MGINTGREVTVLTTLTVDVDSNTLDIDEVNNRVGIGTNAPGTALQIETTAPNVTLKNTTAENSDGGCASKLIFEDHANATLTQIQGSHDGSSDDTKGNVIISTNNGSSLVEGMRIDSTQKATFAGDVTVTGDIIIDDGGSIKEAGGTAAITIDASGNVTKIGQDSFSSGDVVTWDGAKFVGEAPTVGDITGVTAGVGLSGGGSSGDLTLTLDLSELSAVTPTATDSFATLDSDGANEQRTTITALSTLQAGTASATGLSASSGVLSVTDLHPVGVSGSANQLITDDGDGTVTSESNLSFDGSTLSVTGAISCSTDLSVSGGDLEFGNGQNATVTIADTAHNAVGKNLSLTAGKPAAATTNNIAGGALALQSGQGKGSGAGGNITFDISPAGGSGSALNDHDTVLTLAADKSATFAGAVSLGDNNITNVGSIALDSIGADNNDIAINLTDNRGAALNITEAGNAYMDFKTSNGSERINAYQHIRMDGTKKLQLGGGNDFLQLDTDVKLTAAADIVLATGGSVLINTDLTIGGGDLHFGSGQDATVQIGATAHNVAGKPLTISAGSPTAATTNNIAGGALTIQGGAGKGSGAGGDIVFQVANAAGSGSSINSHATAVTISDDKNVNFAADVTVTGDIVLDDGGSLKEAGGTAAITFDGSGNVTKIGQDSPSSDDFLQWDGAKWIATAVSASAVTGVANGSDNRIATFSSGSALNGEANLSFDGSTLAITGDATVSGGDITYGNGQNATLGITATAHNAAGKALTISGGGTTAGTTNNIAGGDVTIAAGQGKGTGASGNIKFQIANSAAGAGSSLNALADAMVLDDLNMLTIKRDIDSEFTALKIYNQSDSGDTNGKVAMQFSLEDTGGNEVDAAKIVCEKQESFTATSGSQDAKLAFWLSHDGTITERMTLSSAGDLAADGDITAGGAIYASEFMYHTGDTDTKIQFTADQINLLAGNVNMLKLKETTQNEAVFFEDGTDCDFRIEAASAAYFFYINSGDNKIFVGGNTANKLTDQMFNIQDGNIALGKNSADAAGSELRFAKSRHATDGNVTTAVNAADNIGEIVFQGSDGDELVIAAKIVGGIDYGTPANNDMPGKLTFFTTPDGSATPTEALRLNQGQHAVLPNGSLLIQGLADGTELGGGTNDFKGMHLDYDGDTNYHGRIVVRGNTADTSRGQFSIIVTAAAPGDATVITALEVDSSGNVATIGGSVNSISDQRLKNNITSLPSMIDKVKLLNAVEFDWAGPIVNDDNSKTTNHDIGFIAQEVESIFPDLIYTTGVRENDDLPDNLKLLTYTSLIPVLTKCIQEQQALIEALTARVTALES